MILSQFQQGAYLESLSHEVVQINPTITYMRVPVLILPCALAALVMAFLLLE